MFKWRKTPLSLILSFNEWEYTYKFIISSVDCLFHQTLTQHITFKLVYKNNYMKNYFIFEEKFTLINDFQISCNSLFISRSLMVRILFNVSNSSFNISFSTNLFFKTLNFMLCKMNKYRRKLNEH